MFGKKETPEQYRARKERQQREYEERQRNREANQRAWAERQAQREREYQERQRQREAASAAKEQLIREANFLRHSTDWKGTHQKMQRLMELWKAAGNAGKDNNDKLWRQFTEARQVFYDARKVATQKRIEEYERKAEAKRSLIDEARKAAFVIDNRYDLASKRMQSIRRRWKEIGSAGKSESALWAEFKTVLKGFNEASRQAYEERKAAREQRSKDRQKTYSDKKRSGNDSKVKSLRTQVGSRHDKYVGLNEEKKGMKRHRHLWVNTDHKSRSGSEGGS